MNKKLKSTKLEKEISDENKPSTPSMSFRFGVETMDKLGALSVYLGKSMATTVKELIHAQHHAQFGTDKAAANEALKKWKAKQLKRKKG